MAIVESARPSSRSNGLPAALGVTAGATVLVCAALVGVGGARLDVPTMMLALSCGALVFALISVFGIVSALARDDVEVALESEPLAGTTATVELRDERRRVLKAIKELEFEHALGKLSAEDFAQMNERYRLRAIELKRALEGVSVPGRARVRELAQHAADEPPQVGPDAIGDHGVADGDDRGSTGRDAEPTSGGVLP